MLLVRHLRLPDWASHWLAYVPTAVIAALLAQQVLMPGGSLSLPPQNWRPLAILPVIAVAVHTRNLIAAVVTGIATMMLLNWWLAA